MGFCTSGRDALDELESQPADIVVSDMRMPGMDGAAFLREVAERHPKTVRLVLSGEADEELTARAIPYSHQWLAKPITAQDLARSLERAIVTRDLVHGSAAREIVASTDKLPVLPRVYSALTAALNEAEVSLDKVTEAIASDPGTSARLLRIANSAYFGLPRHVDSIRDAISFLGTDTIAQVVLASEVFTALGSSVGGISLEGFQARACMVSRLAAELVAGTKHVDTAASAGLLHGIGTLVLAKAQPGAFGAILAAAARGEGDRLSLEKEAFEATHPEVGGALLGIWGLPVPLVEAVAFHLDPSQTEPTGLDALVAVHIARVLITEALGEKPEVGAIMDMELVRALSLEPKIAGWAKRARELVGLQASAAEVA